MAGMIVRIVAYLSLVVALAIEFMGYDYPNVSGAVFVLGAGILLFLALSRAMRTRGKLTERKPDDD
jgi:hypothetical protein